ncbi:MAG: OmpA family protein, partial [Acetobacteraceae bacterium]|nr:OmpA family protein [Acetobacteraceae bacterium]
LPAPPARALRRGAGAARCRPAPTRPLARCLAFALLLAAAPAAAQPRGFSCVGAEQLEDDVFDIPFARGSDRLGPAAASPIAAAAERAQAAPERNICVLGHADREGGAQTATRLAARRAAAVAEALSLRHGIAPERIRAEARSPRFATDTPNRPGRNVSIVLLPAPPPE